jgi:hypothetical protein
MKGFLLIGFDKVKRFNESNRKSTAKNLMVYGNKFLRIQKILENHLQACELKCFFFTNFNDFEIKANLQLPGIIDSSVLKMAKYQLKHSNRFSTKLMLDCEALYIMITMNKTTLHFNRRSE